MQRYYLNDDWYFTREYTDALLKNDTDLEKLEKIRIPHTVCETAAQYVSEKSYQMVSGYRRVLHIEDDWREGHILLTFEGAAHEATVFINGHRAVRHYGGYTAFTVDMMPFLVAGSEQVVVVRLDSRESLNQPPFGGVIDYLTYGGIYRDVYMEVKPAYYITDIYAATPDCHNEQKTLTADITINEMAEGLTISAHLDTWTELDKVNLMSAKDLADAAEAETDETLQHWDFDETRVHFKTSCLNFGVSDIYLWDLDMPFLYVLTVQLKKDHKVIDTKKVRVGFREITFDVDGFYLNGEPIKLRGLNRHQSWPYVGYAMPKSPQQLDADLLKFELGCNVVRTSHYPQSQYFVDRCDEIGLLIVTEVPGWQHIGDTKWKKITVRNVREMVTQYRNHPSVILWGVRINESADDDAFYYKTNQIAHALDLYRQTGGVRSFTRSHLYEDVYTYNDFSHSGENDGCMPKETITSDLDKPYLVTEYNGHMYPTKPGDDEAHRLEHALRHAHVLNAIEAEPEITGGIGWCMFDYQTHQDFGSGDGICYHGVMDMFRNPKLAAAVYKSQTNAEPVFTISSSMAAGDYPASEICPVYAFTNADFVRAYCGDKLIKTYYPDEAQFGSMVHPPVIMDDLMSPAPEDAVLVTGLSKRVGDTLKSMTHKEQEFVAPDHVNPAAPAPVWRFEAITDGEVTGRMVKGAVQDTMLRVMADRQQLVEVESYDVATVHIEAVDTYGNHLTYYMAPLMLRTEGDIALIGPSMVSMAGGFAGTYVKSLGRSGEGRLIVTDAAGEAVIEFTVQVVLSCCTL